MPVRGLLLDVEGVLVGDKRYAAVATAVGFVRGARAADCPLRLITNNTTDDRPTIVSKLTQAGFDFSLEEVLTCTGAAVERLRAAGARRCLVLGTTALRGMFVDAGFEIADDKDVDAVVVGFDTELTYARLQTACDAVLTHGATLLALHHNRLLIDAAGRLAPSVGAIVASIEYATQVEAIIVGKPSADYFRMGLTGLGVPAADVLMVSDDPLTDLVGAKRLGMKTAFALSGKYADRAVLEHVPEAGRPDIVVARVGDLLTEGRVTFTG